MLRAHLFALVPMWLVGLANSVFVNLIGALRHPDALHIGFFLADLTLGACRITLLATCYRRSSRNLPTPTDLFLLGDHLSLLFVGAAALIALRTDDQSLQILTVASTVAISGGLVVRSYVAPRGVVLQLIGCMLPIAVGAILSGNAILLVFCTQIPIYLFVVGNAAFRINRILVATMLAEEDSLGRSLRDSLTGLANRPAFETALEGLCADPAMTGFAVLFIDLDGFKAVNDAYGHGVGDQVLIAAAGRLTRDAPGRSRRAPRRRRVRHPGPQARVRGRRAPGAPAGAGLRARLRRRGRPDDPDRRQRRHRLRRAGPPRRGRTPQAGGFRPLPGQGARQGMLRPPRRFGHEG